MEIREENGIWTRIKGRIRWILEELKEDSVASNPQKPVDCCNPPVYRKTGDKKS